MELRICSVLIVVIFYYFVMRFYFFHYKKTSDIFILMQITSPTFKVSDVVVVRPRSGIYIFDVANWKIVEGIPLFTPMKI